MLPIRLLRTVPSVRPVASSPSPWLQLISGQRIPSYPVRHSPSTSKPNSKKKKKTRDTNRFPPKPQNPHHQTRPITKTTPTLSSSPFRLNTNNNTTPTAPEHDTLEYETAATDKYAPYKPKRTWPPDMKRLSPKHQFRLERKYRRRAALKFARPQWMKITKLVQWGVISCTFPIPSPFSGGCAFLVLQFLDVRVEGDVGRR